MKIQTELIDKLKLEYEEKLQKQEKAHQKIFNEQLDLHQKELENVNYKIQSEHDQKLNNQVKLKSEELETEISKLVRKILFVLFEMFEFLNISTQKKIRVENTRPSKVK